MTATTSEAIPAGMKPWSGGDAAPDDWDGGPVYTYDDTDDENAYRVNASGLSLSANCWRRGNHFVDIIAYTPSDAVLP